MTSLAPYGIDPIDYQGRLEVIFTLLLSTVALLYVVQESIPKISFLTLVDKVVIMTLLSLSLSVLWSYLIKISPNPERLNMILAVANQILYWVANIFLLVPPYLRYKKHIAKVEAKQALKETGLAALKKSAARLDKRRSLTSFQMKEDSEALLDCSARETHTHAIRKTTNSRLHRIVQGGIE